MRIVNSDQGTEDLSIDELRLMFGPDVHRPGPARGRLIAEQIPVWAIIGHLKAIMAATNQETATDAAITQTAAEYDLSRKAVLAALLYYYEHRGAIDALLETNAAALA